MNSTAFSQTPRASGSAISSASFSSPGSSFGRNGAASRGSSTSLDMLQMMSAACRLSAVAPAPDWPRARARSGTTTASVAESTDCTKVVAARAWTHSGTSAGRTAAEAIAGSTGSTSLLPVSSKASRIASLAASETSFLVSHRHAVTAGTTTGRHAATWAGADEQSAEAPARAAARVGHGSSGAVAARSASSVVLAAGAPRHAVAAAYASLAAALTGPFFDPKPSSAAPSPTLATTPSRMRAEDASPLVVCAHRPASRWSACSCASGVGLPSNASAASSAATFSAGVPSLRPASARSVSLEGPEGVFFLGAAEDADDDAVLPEAALVGALDAGVLVTVLGAPGAPDLSPEAAPAPLNWAFGCRSAFSFGMVGPWGCARSRLWSFLVALKWGRRSDGRSQLQARRAVWANGSQPKLCS
mmetsp:Transcript_15108/g.60696  ORF Transcript_15108/g.60696 Transcript_15108/m.60696 type:complete len:417 (-) Transcript_15108:72-1322(-)